MPKTSDFCPRCQSVQVGLRRPDGRFVCLNCSTKNEVAEAAAMPLRVHRYQDVRQSLPLGVTSLAFGLATAIAATPVTLHYQSTGDASTALIIILPAGIVPLLMGLIANRCRWGQAGALLSLAACVQVFVMVLAFEAKKNERPTSARPPDVPGPEIVAPRPRNPSPLETARVTKPAPPVTNTIRRQPTPVPVENDATLLALRAEAERERQHTAEIRKIQNLLNEYYTATRMLEQIQDQHTPLDTNRCRLQAQIIDYDTRIQQLEAELRRDAANRETPTGSVRVILKGVDPPTVKFAEINRLTQEKLVCQAQVTDLNNQIAQLDEQRAKEQAHAVAAGNALTAHCKRIGEPVPKLHLPGSATATNTSDLTRTNPNRDVREILPAP